MSCLVGLAAWRLAATGAEAVRLTAAVGADGLQLDLGGPGRGEWLDTPGRAESLREVAQDTGVHLLAVTANTLNDVGLIAEPAVVRPILIRLLDVAYELGVGLVFVPSFRRSAIRGPAEFDRTVAALRWAAVAAEARGLVLASENVLAPGMARTLAERVASPAFRLLLDTFNPVVHGVSPVALVTELGHVLADQVHLKDGPPEVGASPPLGAGQGGLDDTIAALHRRHVPVRAFVLENDYRDADVDRLAVDIAWTRERIQQFVTPGSRSR
ncbi:sugar phosphate isomerase/epimerase family protein [Krasilnikovia sp. M28-CT-15]|uniref:sugar phosphate isomerase/epimerase family protein n=1 Tax=Krasilnikovia sp. M28-CT-15 TaxID=3373540 RepID=UPI003875BA78